MDSRASRPRALGGSPRCRAGTPGRTGRAFSGRAWANRANGANCWWSLGGCAGSAGGEAQAYCDTCHVLRIARPAVRVPWVHAGSVPRHGISGPIISRSEKRRQDHVHNVHNVHGSRSATPRPHRAGSVVERIRSAPPPARRVRPQPRPRSIRPPSGRAWSSPAVGGGGFLGGLGRRGKPRR